MQVWVALMKQISTQPVTLLPPDNIEMVSGNACGGGGTLLPYITGSAPSRRATCAKPAPKKSIGDLIRELDNTDTPQPVEESQPVEEPQQENRPDLDMPDEDVKKGFFGGDENNQ
jgi:hypothetical protein